MSARSLSSRLTPTAEPVDHVGALRALAEGCGLDLTALEPLQHKPSSPIARAFAEGAAASGTGRRVLVEVALTDAGRRQLRNEAAGRRWATSAGVRCPAVLAHDPQGEWLIGESATPAVLDIAYVDAVLEQAERVGAATIRPATTVDTRSWESARATKLWRAALMAAGGLSVTLFLRSRRAYHELSFDRPVHGDFHCYNVLADADGRPTTVDWEYLGHGPRFSDALRMWSSLPDPHLRAHLVERLLGQCTTVQERRQLGVVARWLVVRQIGENLGPIRQRSSVSLAHARSMLPEALALADRLDVS